MITLYHTPGSCSLAVRAALVISGLSHEVKLVDMKAGEHHSEAFKKISPLSKVPAIVVDGESLTEGAAILQYIAERAPNSRLLPEAGTFEKAQALKWLMFVYSNIHPHYARAFMPGRYGNDEADIKAKAENALHELFAIIDEQLTTHDFIAGDQLSIADLYLAVAIHWEGVLTKSLTTSYKNIADYLPRIMKLPSAGAVYQAELT